jgi:hypothetical protein
VYLSRVCAATPVSLRPCEQGEPGVVISRYHRIEGYDWIAIPLLPYLYAVERPEEVPAAATAELVAQLRDQYRRSHLEAIAPDKADGETPGGDWTQLIGAAYDRKIYSFEIETSEEQDRQLIAKLNSAQNRSHFNLLFHNCADFARGILNFYYPRAAHRGIFVDEGITTPKQVAKCLARYAGKHSDLRFSSFTIEQVPGDAGRSWPIRSVLEAFVKSKKYVLPAAVLDPLVTSGVVVAYFVAACCDPHRSFTRRLEPESQPAAIVADLEFNLHAD